MTNATSDPNEPRPIDLRIVVDGASTAGKTTTARSLGERLGRPVVTPEEQDGRTLLFDWMDHEGGRSDGRPIRTQVVAVPGHLPHLRARLLVTADVVLFVADTSASGIRSTEVALAQVRALLDAYEGVRPGLVVQANKRDADDALPMDEVHERLAIGGDDLVIETVALTGEGVRQSYVYAVRLGLRHAKAVDGPRIAERQVTADALLRELDQDPRPVREVDPAATTEPEPEPEVEAEPVADVVEPAEAVEPQEPDGPEEAEEAASRSADAVPGDGPDAIGAERPLEPVGAATAPGAAAMATLVTTDDRPEHDHPRAWRRWFDR